MFQRVRTAGRLLPGNLPKIHSQDLPSLLYASKPCSSRFDHRLCLLVCERLCSSSLEHPSPSLLGSGLLSLKPPSSSLLDGLPPCDARASASSAFARLGLDTVGMSCCYFQKRYPFSFVGYCTWIAPGVRSGRAARVSSHEQPSFFILSIVPFSSGFYGTRCLLDCKIAARILECATVL